jgi:hypothetical protein
MRFSSLVLQSDGTVSVPVAELMTDAQWARLAFWSMQTGEPVRELLRSARFVAEAETLADDCKTVMLRGTLPNCGLYGGLCSDGSVHT